MKNHLLATLTVLALGAFGAASSNANANPIAITSYDVSNVQASGFGGWTYTYTGTVTSLGNGLVDLTNGSGTLNDTIISNSASNNMLWRGATLTITLHLSGVSDITSIDFYGNNSGNAIPGGIGAADITIGGSTAAFKTTTFGNGDNALNLSASALSGIGTSTITIANISGSVFDGYYNIGEIELSGTPGIIANVSEPAGMALLGVGLLGTWVMARRRRQSSTTHTVG